MARKENALREKSMRRFVLLGGGEARQKSPNRNQKALPAVSKFALCVRVGPTGFEPVTYRL
jgi:hypothetical protein